ncbi:MAG: sn-glycerol-3-phosphate ABC transporter ATP-binding protein UgpC [Rubellimicrobium sp.]|nr:sn-glycerol-3-phosphate ABC transporter ATP-binding protein UgpC [Rubellimicrobium sp.]
MASVELQQVSKRYGPVHVIRDLDLAVEKGEFVALVGPSGCGKSTLLRMIAGLEDISGGDIRIAGRVVNELSPRERNIAMVFQNYALYPHMSVRGNMGFSLMLRKQPAPAISAEVEKAANILGLGKLLDRLPGQLSGGQRQRVAMGRAIVRNTEVYLFDEPLSNLDAQLRVQMRSEIKALHRTLGNTMIYVTHDQVEAMTMADRIVVLREGVIEQAGAPLDLYDRPANVFVAGFIGSPGINLIEGRIAAAAGGSEITLPDGVALDLPEGLPRLPEGTEVICGIRPESVAIGADGTEAEIHLIEPTGSDTQVHLRIGRTALLALCRERLTVGEGARVHLRIRPGGVHLFDKSTGRRID